MGNQHFRLESLPPHLRVQAERQLGVSNTSTVLSSPEDKSKTRHIVFPIPGSTPPEGYQEPRRRRGGMYKANTQAGLGNAPQPPIVPSPDGFKSIAEMRAEKKASRKRKYLTPDMAHTLVKSCVVSPDGNEVKFILGVDPAMLATAQQKGAFVGKDNRVHFFTKAKVAKAQKTLILALRPFAPNCSKWGNVPVALNLDFCFPFQKTSSRKSIVNYTYHTQRPDSDNIFKEIGDAMTEAGFWEDDSVIADLHLRKFRVVIEPRIEITIRKLPTVCKINDLFGSQEL